MAIQAKVSLKALNGNSDIAERTLYLQQHRLVQIGRASKTPSKGLQAAVDNAWFDSAVMSRSHAELYLDAEKEAVVIRDTGSMHGTYINDHQLQPETRYELSNGDILVFGAEVKRNTETFPPCVFQVSFEFLPFKANISYAFPEESDDEDYEISDDEDYHKPSSEDGVSIESQPHKSSEANNAIDLTGDDSPTNSDVEYTGKSDLEKNVIGISAGRPADIRCSADPVSVAAYLGNAPVLVESDEEDSLFTSDADAQSEIEYAANDASSAFADSLDDQDGDVDEGAYELQDVADKSSEETSGSASHEWASMLSQLPKNSELRNKRKHAYDQEGDFGLADAAAQGVRALFDDGLIDCTTDHYTMDEENESDIFAYEVPAQSNMDGEALGGTTQHIEYADYRPGQPSDLAQAAPVSATALHMSPESIIRHEFRSLTSQSLGDKTGKHDFFAAREHNRDKFYRVGSHLSEPVESEAETKSFAKQLRILPEEAERVDCSMAKMDEIKRRTKEEADLQLSKPSDLIAFTTPSIRVTNSGKPFCSEEDGRDPIQPAVRISFAASYLDDHTQAPKPIRDPSPELDMTSAVAYNESKASLASADKNDRLPGRSGFSTNNVVHSDDRTPKSLKRKAGDISEAIEDEIRIWAESSPAVDGLERSIKVSALPPQDVAFNAQSKTASSTQAEASEHRPSKRLRKIAESVGYVALGGATLFGALVLSAPDFL